MISTSCATQSSLRHTDSQGEKVFLMFYCLNFQLSTYPALSCFVYQISPLSYLSFAFTISNIVLTLFKNINMIKKKMSRKKLKKKNSKKNQCYCNQERLYLQVGLHFRGRREPHSKALSTGRYMIKIVIDIMIQNNKGRRHGAAS